MFLLIGVLASCTLGAADLGDCSTLAGGFEAREFGFSDNTGVFDDEIFDDGRLGFGFGDRVFDLDFSSPGFNDVDLVGEPFEATGNTLTFNEPFIDRVEPGVRGFECEVINEDTFALRNDDMDFDFDSDGFLKTAHLRVLPNEFKLVKPFLSPKGIVDRDHLDMSGTREVIVHLSKKLAKPGGSNETRPVYSDKTFNLDLSLRGSPNDSVRSGRCACRGWHAQKPPRRLKLTAQ